jgi:hypothetical protein
VRSFVRSGRGVDPCPALRAPDRAVGRGCDWADGFLLSAVSRWGFGPGQRESIRSASGAARLDSEVWARGEKPVRPRVWGLGSESDDSVFGIVGFKTSPVSSSSGEPVARGRVDASVSASGAVRPGEARFARKGSVEILSELPPAVSRAPWAGSTRSKPNVPKSSSSTKASTTRTGLSSQM